MLAQAGFLPESEKLLTQVARRLSSDPRPRTRRRANMQLAQGFLELQKGNTRESIQLIEDALGDGASLYDSSRILAEAWSQEGELQKAAQVLEETSKQKHLVMLQAESPILWLRIRAALASLYRETGRNEEAREIEEDLRKHLAYADSDHPIILQLAQTRQLAVRQAAN